MPTRLFQQFKDIQREMESDPDFVRLSPAQKAAARAGLSRAGKEQYGSALRSAGWAIPSAEGLVTPPEEAQPELPFLEPRETLPPEIPPPPIPPWGPSPTGYQGITPSRLSPEPMSAPMRLGTAALRSLARAPGRLASQIPGLLGPIAGALGAPNLGTGLAKTAADIVHAGQEFFPPVARPIRAQTIGGSIGETLAEPGEAMIRLADILPEQLGTMALPMTSAAAAPRVAQALANYPRLAAWATPGTMAWLGAAPAEISEIGQSQVEKFGRLRSPKSALALGAAAGYLESLVPERIVGRLLRAPADAAMRSAVRGGFAQAIGQIAKGLPREAIGEGATELGQTFLEAIGRDWGDNAQAFHQFMRESDKTGMWDAINRSPLAREAFNSAVIGAAAGGVFGGAARTAQTAQYAGSPEAIWDTLTDEKASPEQQRQAAKQWWELNPEVQLQAQLGVAARAAGEIAQPGASGEALATAKNEWESLPLPVRGLVLSQDPTLAEKIMAAFAPPPVAPPPTVPAPAPALAPPPLAPPSPVPTSVVQPPPVVPPQAPPVVPPPPVVPLSPAPAPAAPAPPGAIPVQMAPLPQPQPGLARFAPEMFEDVWAVLDTQTGQRTGFMSTLESVAQQEADKLNQQEATSARDQTERPGIPGVLEGGTPVQAGPEPGRGGVPVGVAPAIPGGGPGTAATAPEGPAVGRAAAPGTTPTGTAGEIGAVEPSAGPGPGGALAAIAPAPQATGRPEIERDVLMRDAREAATADDFLGKYFDKKGNRWIPKKDQRKMLKNRDVETVTKARAFFEEARKGGAVQAAVAPGLPPAPPVPPPPSRPRVETPRVEGETGARLAPRETPPTAPRTVAEPMRVTGRPGTELEVALQQMAERRKRGPVQPELPTVEAPPPPPKPARRAPPKLGTRRGAIALFSPTQEIVEKKMPRRAPVEQVQKILEQGKAEEVADLGLRSWLGQQKGLVEKGDVISFIQNNGPEIATIIYGEPGRGQRSWDVSFERDQEKGTVSVPTQGLAVSLADAYRNEGFKVSIEGKQPVEGFRYKDLTLEGGENYREVLLTVPLKEGEPAFKSSHFSPGNILAHVRLTDRTTNTGEKILLAEEIQSDWVKAARRGLAPKPPMAGSWVGLAIKKILDMAIDGGYSRVAWTTGDQQAARYSVQISEEPQQNQFSNFYDREISNIANDLLARRFGSRVQPVDVETAPGVFESVHSVPITDPMRVESLRMPLYSVEHLVAKWSAKATRPLWNMAKLAVLRGWDFASEFVPRAIRRFGEEVGSLLSSVYGAAARVLNARISVLSRRRGMALIPGRKKIAFAWRVFRRYFQDKMLPLKELEEATLKREYWNPHIQQMAQQGVQVNIEDLPDVPPGTQLSESQRGYVKSELFLGRVQPRVESFEKRHWEPLTALIAEKGLTLREVGLYAYARHAEERNAEMARINPYFRGANEKGSGMTRQEAVQIVQDFFQQGKTTALNEIMQKVDAIREETIDTLLKGSLISLDQARAWKAKYKDYVPLRGIDGEEDVFGIGRGFDIRGKESKRAMGRETMADPLEILPYMREQAERAIIRSEKNRVLEAFLRFLEDHPDPDLFKISNQGQHRFINPQTGEVEIGVDPLYRSRENVFSIKRNGFEHLVEWLDKDNFPGLIEGLKNLETAKSSKMVEVLQKSFGGINRVLAIVNTALSPDFPITNFMRDIQTAMVGVSAEEGVKLAKQILGNVPSALLGAWNAIRDDNATGQWENEYREFVMAGGKVGYFDLHSIEQKTQALEKMIDEKARAGEPWMKAKEAVVGVGKLLLDMSAATELATRLAAFKAAKDSGKSTEEAAYFARDLTVNFNRKGVWGTMMNTMYLFSNAAIQGNAKVLKIASLARKDSTVAGMLGAAVLAGAFLDQIGRALGGKDKYGKYFWDKIPDYVKNNNLVLMDPRGSGRYIKIPLPYGFNLFPAIGMNVSAAISGSKTPLKAAASVANAAFSAFNPLGAEIPVEDPIRGVALSVVPTALEPVFQVWANQDYLGRPIRPEQPQFGAPQPYSQLYWKGTSPFWRGVAQELNRAQGGSIYRSGGVLDISPAAMEHFAEFLGGGLLKSIRRGADVTTRLWKGDDLPLHVIPVVRRFVGEPDERFASKEFAQNIKEFMTHKKEMDGIARGEITDPAEKKRIRSETWKTSFLKEGKKLQKTISEWKDMAAGFRDKGNLARARKYEEMIEDKKNAFNARVEKRMRR